MSTIYENVDLVKVEDLRKLSERMHLNLEEAKSIYNEVKRFNDSGSFVDNFNLFNVQFVMDWQDGLNKVSITRKEEL